jgi:hypothetical protein
MSTFRELNHDLSGPRGGVMNRPERRSSPGAFGPDPFPRGIGEGGLFMTQWIDGDELLRARWSNITGLLLRAIRARAVQPFDRITLDPVTDDKDPCLFCDHPGVGAENCSHAVAYLAPGQDIEAMAAGRVNLLPPVCRRDCTPEALDQRVRGYAFLRPEVEAFERAQAGGAQPTRQPTAPETHDLEVTVEDLVARGKRLKWHDGRIMLEVKARWGTPPKKTMERAEIAAAVNGESPPCKKTDASTWYRLENLYKNTVAAYRRQQTEMS